MLSLDVDHFRKRKPRRVSDETVLDASFKLADRQFVAWKYALLQGFSNVQISDLMSDAETIVFPSDVNLLLVQAAKRGFAIPDEPKPSVVREARKELA